MAEWMAISFTLTVLSNRMKRGWKLGHKPTNYDRWVNASEPYDVSVI